MAVRYLTAPPKQDHAEQRRLLDVRERAFAAQMSGELRRTVRDVAADIAKGGQGAAALDAHTARTRLLFQAQYTATFRVFGNRIINAAQKSGLRVLETKDAQGIFERLMMDYIRTIAARKVQQVTETTKEQIRRSIAKWNANGLGTDEIARQLRKDLGGSMSKLRAHVIARTETHSAANAANDAAVESLGISRAELSKQWVAAQDERTREDHVAADGQIRLRDEPFNVGGVSLDFPGDPSGPAEQIINCRCTYVFLFNY
jgi:hypothetical protein